MNREFEDAWREKLRRGLDEAVGAAVRARVMGEETGEHARAEAAADARETISWTRRVMARLEAQVDETRRNQVLMQCACRYPPEGLREIRERYAQTRDLELAHQMLQEKFEFFLKHDLGLSGSRVAEILRRGWGLAGVRRGHTIIATKIPRSGNLDVYLQEEDRAAQRGYYCHCPRVREAPRLAETVPLAYCYCGAGYYRGVWEEILQGPVEVEVMETVLAGGEVCRFRISV